MIPVALACEMEEGMGIVREGHALSEQLGPAMGRGGKTISRPSLR
jgi:hypothetical protein